tara:strand:- start:24 stop:260 length:237 start_codon:yes stop_codon:yes gene_type:complete
MITTQFFVLLSFMMQFILGVGIGIWIGTKYDCRHAVESCEKYIAANMPKERSTKTETQAEPLSVKTFLNSIIRSRSHD